MSPARSTTLRRTAISSSGGAEQARLPEARDPDRPEAGLLQLLEGRALVPDRVVYGSNQKRGAISVVASAAGKERGGEETRTTYGVLTRSTGRPGRAASTNGDGELVPAGRDLGGLEQNLDAPSGAGPAGRHGHGRPARQAQEAGPVGARALASERDRTSTGRERGRHLRRHRTRSDRSGPGGLHRGPHGLERRSSASRRRRRAPTASRAGPARRACGRAASRRRSTGSRRAGSRACTQPPAPPRRRAASSPARSRRRARACRPGSPTRSRTRRRGSASPCRPAPCRRTPCRAGGRARPGRSARDGRGRRAGRRRRRSS